MEIINTNSKAISTTANDQTMAVNMTAQAFNAILEKLYNDPLSAVIREITTNAIEAQQLSKTNKKIIIQVPNTIFSDFVFRDFGNGLDDVEINKYLNCLFSSTKDKSNQFPGGFGLGAKSPLALVDTFNITSYKNGKAYHCIWYKKEGSMPVLSIVDIDDTTEENGVEVKIPLASVMKQYGNFNHDVLNRIRKELFLFRGTIDFVKGYNTEDQTIINNTIWEDSIIKSISKVNNFEIAYSTVHRKNSHWALRQNTNLNLLVSVGNVLYPVSDDFTANVFKNIKLFSSENSSSNFLIIDVDIGLLKIAPNRESIMDTPDNYKIVRELVEKEVENYYKEKDKIFKKLKVSKNFNSISSELKLLKDKYGLDFNRSSNSEEVSINLFQTSKIAQLTQTDSIVNLSKFFSSNISCCSVKYYSSNKKTLNSNYSNFVNLFFPKHSDVTYNFILLDSDEESLLGKQSYYNYVNEHNLKVGGTYVFVGGTSVIQELKDCFLKADIEYLKFAKINIKIHENKDIVQHYKDFKAKNSNTRVKTAITRDTFQGLSLYEDTSKIYTSSNFHLREVYSNNVYKKINTLTDKTIKFGSEYLTNKKIMVVNRSNTTLPITEMTSIKSSLLANLKGFSFVSCSDGIYPTILKNLLMDKSLTVYHKDNLYTFPVENELSPSVYLSNDFKYHFTTLLFSNLFAKVFESSYTARRAYKHFCESELQECISELYNSRSKSEPHINAMIEHLESNKTNLLDFRKSSTQLYAESLDQSYLDLINNIVNKVKTKIVTSEKWKNHISDVFSHNLYSSSVVSTILINTKLQDISCKDYFEKI